MRTSLLVVMMAAGHLFIALVDAEAARSVERIGIVVRVYDGVRMPSTDVTAAIATAGGILAAAGVNVDWHQCEAGNAVHADATCAAPLAAREFALRLLAGNMPAGSDGLLPLGYSLIDMRLHTGSLATVYPGRVAWLAEASGVNVSTLLGRAIAHEIGHLLLGTNAHRGAGIMQAIWSSETLRRSAADDWLFTGRDAAEIRAALRTRVPPPQQIATNRQQPKL